MTCRGRGTLITPPAAHPLSIAVEEGDDDAMVDRQA